MEVICIIFILPFILLLLAQYTEKEGLSLGGLFDGLKVNVKDYKDIIDKFKDIEDFKEYTDNGVINWNAIAEAIGCSEEAALSYFKGLEDGNGVINNQAASVDGLGAHLKKAGNSAGFAAAKTALFNAALNAGIMLAVTVAINLLAKAVDNTSDSLEEVEARIQDNKTALSDYTSKVEELTKKLEELNQTDVKYLSDDERKELETEAAYINSQLELYNQLADAKQKAINDDYIKATMGVNQETAYKKMWEELSNGKWGDLYSTLEESSKSKWYDFIVPLGLSRAFKSVDDGNYFSEADKLLDKYQKLQNKQLQLEEAANKKGNNETLDQNLEKTKSQMIQTAANLSQYIEQIQTARDALANSANKDDYADIIAEMDEAIAKYQKVLTGNVYASEYLGISDLQRDLIGVRDVLKSISDDTGASSIFDPIIEQIDDLISAVELLSTYSFTEILDLDKEFLANKLGELQEQLHNFKAELTDEEFLDKLKTTLSASMPPELVENWERFKNTIRDIREQITELMQEIDSRTGLSDILGGLEEHLDNIRNVLSNIIDKFGWIFKDAIEAWNKAHDLDYSERFNIEAELKALEEGGSVNLTLRPQIDTSELNKKGWNAGEGIATVFSSTFSNEDETVAINFTPIIADPKTGEYLGVLSPDELQTYAEGVIAGTRKDDLNLQIGAKFTGDNAIEEATAVAEKIHELHEKYYDNTIVAAKTALSAKKPLTFTETISQVQSLSTGLEKLGKIYTDVKNKEDFDWSSILNNEEFANTFSSMGTVYDNFIKTVSNAPDDIEACQEAFNKLAASYIYNTKDDSGNNIMDNLTRSTKDATVAMLEQMGVVNALEIVETELTKKEEVLEAQRIYATEHAGELTDATYEQANAYITEANCSEIAKKYLAQLYLQKKLFNGSEISTEEDCKNLIELAKTAGYSASVLTRLEKLKKMFADNPIMSNVVKEDVNRAIKNIFNEAQADIDGIDFEIDFDYDKASKSASSAAKSFTDLLDKELNVLDKKMEAGYIDFNDYIKARLDLIEDYYRQGKLSADEYYSYLEKHYKQELSYKDKVIKAVTRRIDKEIDSLGKQKDDIESYYKVQIDALEKEKTLLQDKNRERQREIDLQKAQYELERAKNQRTKLIYSEDKGMHYVADDQSIRDAQQEVENAEYELKISEIEKAITKLEEARDKETDAIDDMIDKLKEYRDQWNDITSAYEEEQEDLLAAQMLGRDWEKDILDTRLDKLNEFKDDYIKIQQAMVDAAYQAAQAMEKQEKVTIGDSSSGGNKGGNGGEHGYEVVDEANPTSPKNRTFPTEKEANEHAKKMNEQKAQENGMTLAQFNNSDIPGYYVKKYHTGLKQGLVDQHSFDEDFKLVQEVGLGEKEVPAILKEGEAVVTPEQISNIADGLSVESIIDMQKRFADYVEKMGGIDAVTGHIARDHSKRMNEAVNQMMNSNTNIVNNRNMQPVINGGINITCPGITSQEVARQVGAELNNMFNGFHNFADQQSRIR